MIWGKAISSFDDRDKSDSGFDDRNKGLSQPQPRQAAGFDDNGKSDI